MPVRLTVDEHDPVATERILRALPEWFGIESAIQNYVHDSRSMQNVLAYDGPHVVGVLLLNRHFPTSAEIHLVAVAPEHRSQGVGRALVAEAERVLRVGGATYVQVNTVGPSHPSPEYAQTRGFYAAVGFAPVVELLDYWPGIPQLIQIKHLTCGTASGT